MCYPIWAHINLFFDYIAFYYSTRHRLLCLIGDKVQLVDKAEFRMNLISNLEIMNILSSDEIAGYASACE